MGLREQPGVGVIPILTGAPASHLLIAATLAVSIREGCAEVLAPLGDLVFPKMLSREVVPQLEVHDRLQKSCDFIYIEGLRAVPCLSNNYVDKLFFNDI